MKNKIPVHSFWDLEIDNLYTIPIKYSITLRKKQKTSFFNITTPQKLFINGFSIIVCAITIVNLIKLCDKINTRHVLEQKKTYLKKLSLSNYHKFISVITFIQAYTSLENEIRFNNSLNTVNIYAQKRLFGMYININVYSESTVTNIFTMMVRYRSHKLLTAQKQIYTVQKEYDRAFFIINNLKKVSDSLMLEHFDYIPIKKVNINR